MSCAKDTFGERETLVGSNVAVEVAIEPVKRVEVSWFELFTGPTSTVRVWVGIGQLEAVHVVVAEMKTGRVIFVSVAAWEGVKVWVRLVLPPMSHF